MTNSDQPLGLHGVQAPETQVRYRYELQWRPYDDDQWWTDLNNIPSLEEAQEALAESSTLKDNLRRLVPHRIVRVTETCTYDIIEETGD